MTTSYRVTGAYVTVKTMTSEGPRILGLYAGAMVPDDVEKSAIDHLVSHNLIEALPAPAPVPEAKPAPVKPASKSTDKPAEPKVGPGPTTVIQTTGTNAGKPATPGQAPHAPGNVR